MGNKLYVGNLAYSVRDDSLQQAFSLRTADRDRERVLPPRHLVGRERRRCGASHSGVWPDRSPWR